MLNPTSKIRDRIHGKSQSKSRKFEEGDLIEVHHRFMAMYGWIPVEEFMKIPIPTFWNLHHQVNEQMKRDNEEKQAMAGMKKPNMRKR